MESSYHSVSKDRQDMNSMPEEQHHPVFGALRRPWNYLSWNSHITVCFTPPDSGWADLVLVSSAFG